MKNRREKILKPRFMTERPHSLGKIVGGVIHEINSPLDGTMRYLNLALFGIEHGKVRREYLEEAKLGLTRIAKITRSLSEFCWSLSPHQGLIDINRLIEESLSMFKYNIVSSNIEVKKFLSPHLPKLPDYNLKLAFNNIIKNACEAMENGGTLRIYTARHNGFIEARFEDSGKGIPPELQKKIFESFFTTKDIGKGSGLGLAIAREIIHRYKGNIFIKSRVGRSAKFIIQLPVNGRTQQYFMKKVKREMENAKKEDNDCR